MLETNTNNGSQHLDGDEAESSSRTQRAIFRYGEKMQIFHKVTRRDLFAKYGPASLFLMAALRAERGLSATRRGKYIAMHTPHGFSIPNISPAGGVGTTVLTDEMLMPLSLSPLIPFRDNLTVLRGVCISGAGLYESGLSGRPNGDAGNTHNTGTVWFATGADCTYAGGDDGATSGKYATAASFDEIVEQRKGKSSEINALLGYQPDYGLGRPATRLSYFASGDAKIPSKSARDIFRSVLGADGNALFSHCGMPPPVAAPPAATNDQKSRMDANISEFNSLINSPRLGTAEKTILQNMMAQLRSLEKTTAGPSGAPLVASSSQIDPFCERMKMADYQGAGQPPDPGMLAQNASLIFDIITLAMVLDITDSATLDFTPAGGEIDSPGYGNMPYVMNGQNLTTPSGLNLHGLSHEIGFSNQQRHAMQSGIDKFHAQQIAVLAKKLQGFPLGQGTLLDETVINWGSDIAGRTDQVLHTSDDAPMFLIGGKALDNMPSSKLLTFNNMPSNASIFTALAPRFGLAVSAISTPEHRNAGLF